MFEEENPLLSRLMALGMATTLALIPCEKMKKTSKN